MDKILNFKFLILNLRNSSSLGEKKGFTIIELVVAVGIIGILAALGTAVFSRSLRGSSVIETRRSLDDRARVISTGLSRFFQEGEMVSLDGQTRANCLASGSVKGDSAVMMALDNLSTTV